MAVKITKHDKIFSLLIRERTAWVCESCSKYYPQSGENGQLQCSHYVTRGRAGTRYDPNNAQAHCAGCHFDFTHYPGKHYKHYVEVFGEGMEELITLKSNQTCKRTKVDKEDLYKHMKEQHKAMLIQRSEGVEGRIEFIGWD